MEISDYFSEDSCLIVNGDDEYLSKLRAEKDAISYSLCSFGKDWKNTIVLKSIENLDNKTNFVVKLEDKEEEFSIPTVGEHNVYNAMSAIWACIVYIIYDKVLTSIYNILPITSGNKIHKTLSDLINVHT